MAYIIEGLSPQRFERFLGMTYSELAAHNAIRYAVTNKPGFPCRVTLEDADPGETAILINHFSREESTPFRASHAIFVRESAVAPARFEDDIPPVLLTRALSLRGFDAAGMMADAITTVQGGTEEGLLKLFEDPRIVEVDAHNVARGCFLARARRM